MQEKSLFEQFPKLKVWFMVSLGVAFAGLLGVLVYRAVWSASLTLIAAPHNARILLNGKEVENKKTLQVRPGEYEIRLERDGFDGEERKITVRGGDEVRLMFALLPSDGNYAWYIENPEDGLILDSVMSARAGEQDEELADKFPILAKLPHRTNFYELTLFALPSSSRPKLVLQLAIFEIPRDGLFATPEKFAEYSAECRTWLLEQGLAADEFEIVSGN
jgi:hypothetical protein